MTKRLPVVLSLVAWVVVVGVASAENLIPTPEFSEHVVPVSLPAETRSVAFEWVDLGALAAGLIVASLAALRWRSRRVLFGVAIVSLLWLGFWREGCVCPIGAIQNVTQAIFDPGYVVPVIVVVLFALPLLFALEAGRAYCAGVCPLGAIQELVVLRPIRVPAWLEHALGLLAYVYLGAAVLYAATGSAFVICRYDPFVAFFRRSGSLNMLIFGGCFLVVGIFVGRPYCRYLCPYGAILGLLSKVSRRRVRIPPDECIQCKLCEDACPYGAIQAPTVDQKSAQRIRGRRRLAVMLLAPVCLVVLGAWLGSAMRGSLARLDPTVRLAEQVRHEDRVAEQIRFGEDVDPVEPTDASQRFREEGKSVEALYQAAFEQTERFALGGLLFGAWVGLVIGAKLVHLSVRRRRTDYQPEPANCVACGRCFWYCPNEQQRLGLIQGIGVAGEPPAERPAESPSENSPDASAREGDQP
jgi:ferredoxin